MNAIQFVSKSNLSWLAARKRGQEQTEAGIRRVCEKAILEGTVHPGGLLYGVTLEQYQASHSAPPQPTA